MIGSHVIKSWSHTQKTVALSSGEAELTAMVKVTCEGLGVASLMKDWGREMKILIHADSSAALGVARRRGAGKLRHVRIGMLWLQELRDDEGVEFVKVLGKSNPADLMTKFLGAPMLEEHCRRLLLSKISGRAEMASDVSRGIVSYLFQLCISL